MEWNKKQLKFKVIPPIDVFDLIPDEVFTKTSSIVMILEDIELLRKKLKSVRKYGEYYRFVGLFDAFIVYKLKKLSVNDYFDGLFPDLEFTELNNDIILTNIECCDSLLDKMQERIVSLDYIS